MDEYIYCIYLGKDMGDIGPRHSDDVLLLVSGRYHLVDKFKAGKYTYARTLYSDII